VPDSHPPTHLACIHAATYHLMPACSQAEVEMATRAVSSAEAQLAKIQDQVQEATQVSEGGRSRGTGGGRGLQLHEDTSCSSGRHTGQLVI
jgi:hypothetical protein